MDGKEKKIKKEKKKKKKKKKKRKKADLGNGPGRGLFEKNKNPWLVCAQSCMCVRIWRHIRHAEAIAWRP